MMHKTCMRYLTSNDFCIDESRLVQALMFSFSVDGMDVFFSEQYNLKIESKGDSMRFFFP